MKVFVKVVDHQLGCLIDNYLSGTSKIDPELALELRDAKQTNLVSVKALKALKAFYKDQISIYDWCKKGDLVLPRPEQRPQSPEYVERINRLRREQEEREYARMVSNVDSAALYKNDLSSLNVGQELAVINRHLLLLLNTILTVGCAFLAAYYGSPYVSDIFLHFSYRLLFAIGFGWLVFLSDLYFIAKTLAD